MTPTDTQIDAMLAPHARLVNGYRLIAAKGHLRADKSGYVREHILCVELAIRRPLDLGHEVHHVNGIKSDNSPGNLVACEDHAYHMLLHRRAAALIATGDPNSRRCKVCSAYDTPSNLIALRVHGQSRQMAHRDCLAKQSTVLRERRRVERLKTGWVHVPHALRTHCPRGHPYSGDNLIIGRNVSGGPRRSCRECGKRADAMRRARTVA